jgi:hypothetical protein
LAVGVPWGAKILAAFFFKSPALGVMIVVVLTRGATPISFRDRFGAMFSLSLSGNLIAIGLAI